MKVSLLSTSSSRNAGGLYNCVICLGKSLVKMVGAEVSVLAFDDEYSQLDDVNYQPLNLMKYHIIGPPGVGFTIDLSEKLTESAPEVMHMHGIWLYTSYLNYKFCKINNVPYVLTTHGMLDPWILSNRKWKKKLGLFLYENAHIKNANCIHALNQEEYNAIRKLGYTNPIAVIPNGVNLPTHDKKPSTPKWKQNDDRKVLLFLSRLHPKKGVENLISAWAKISFKNDWKLVIAGESKDQKFNDRINTLISEHQLLNDVYLIGSQFHDDKEGCFVYADAFVLPSFSEGMPMAVLEAWSYNLPVLMTAACNLPRGFEASAAIKIAPEEASILEGLNQLFNMGDEERKLMGANGFNLVKENYTWDAIAGQMQDVYLWISGKGPKPSIIK